jgi:hypothetical protein
MLVATAVLAVAFVVALIAAPDGMNPHHVLASMNPHQILAGFTGH